MRKTYGKLIVNNFSRANYTEKDLEKTMKRVYNGSPRFAKRASYGVNQAHNILNYFGEPTVRAWAKGDPSGSAIASELADIDFDGSVAKALREAIGYQAKARFDTNRKNTMNHTRHRANRKRAKEDLYFYALDRSGEVVEVTAKPDGDGYIWTYQGPNFEDWAMLEMTLPLPEAYDLFLSTFGLTKGDYPGPEMYTANHKANRKNAMNRTSRRANHKRAYFIGEMDWENIADEGDPIYGSSGEGLDGFYYSFYVYADDFNLVFEAQNEDTMDPKEVWTYEHGGDIPSGEYLAALGDAMAVDFVRTGGVSNPIGNVFRRANRKTASEELALVVFDQIGGDLYEEVSDDLDAGDYEKVVDYMSQWDYGEYHDFENESDLIGYVEDMGRYVLNYTFTRAPFVALYAKAENHRSHRRANRKVAEYDPTNVFQNEGVWEIAEMVWDSRLLSYDVSDEVVEETIRNYSETFLGEVADTYFVDSVMSILKENLKHSNRRASLKVSYSKEDEFEVHDEVVEKFPGGESALADLFDYTNLDQAEVNSAKVMPYIEDAVFSRGGDRDDVDFAYDNLEYYFQTEY